MEAEDWPVEEDGTEWASDGVDFELQDLTVENACVIADRWKYPGEYAFYDMTADPEDYEEFVSPALWSGDHLQVMCGHDLVGFLSVEPIEVDVVSIGLGVRPDLTGQGNGARFVAACVDHIRRKRPAVRRVSLSVATFNRRAIRAYRRNGFVELGTHAQETNGGVFEFCDMALDLR